MHPSIKTIIFDLGGVLIDWNPRYLYRSLIDSEDEMEHFLTKVATPDWNEEQDAGRSLAEATSWLVKKHPEHEELIRAFYGRWPEMLNGPITGTVNILRELRDNGRHSIFALTNWSAETWPVALAQFEFLQWFEGILVSGQEGVRKPFAEIYHLIEERFPLELAHSVFIDDNLKNVEGARAVGLRALHFSSPEQLRADLVALGVLNA